MHPRHQQWNLSNGCSTHASNRFRSIEGRASSTPAFATASPDPESIPPVVAIAPHGTRTIHVFYPLPPDLSSAEKPPWQYSIHGACLYRRQGPIADDDGILNASRSKATRLMPTMTVFRRKTYNPYVYGYDYWDSPFYYNSAYIGFRGVWLPREYWGGHVFARGWGWGRPGYYHPGYYGHGRSRRLSRRLSWWLPRRRSRRSPS